MPVVINHILGGIGNQMFQYAAGRALSIRNKQQYVLDLNGFQNYSLHNGFELERVFAITPLIVDASTIKKFLGWRALPLAGKLLRRPQFAWLRGSKLVVEPSFRFWADLFNRRGDSYLSGYWQSEFYFKSVENAIREDFTFKIPLDGKNAELALEFLNIQAVSLHVRRGDYISDSKTGKIMHTCSLDYYQNAINYIAQRVNSPTFYIFADDTDWVKQNLHLDFPSVYVNHNKGDESYRDMQLMSLCQHHIIANSSFSWWAAWLNAKRQKIVIAPFNWFRNGIDDSDLIPADWVRL